MAKFGGRFEPESKDRVLECLKENERLKTVYVKALESVQRLANSGAAYYNQNIDLSEQVAQYAIRHTEMCEQLKSLTLLEELHAAILQVSIRGHVEEIERVTAALEALKRKP